MVSRGFSFKYHIENGLQKNSMYFYLQGKAKGKVDLNWVFKESIYDTQAMRLRSFAFCIVVPKAKSPCVCVCIFFLICNLQVKFLNYGVGRGP